MEVRKMKRMMLLLFICALVGMTQAAITITNGNFETDAPTDNNTYDVVGWFDKSTEGAQTENYWWESTWYGPIVSPTGSSAMGLSYMGGSNTSWAYQGIGVNDEGLTQLTIGFTCGSFTDAGADRNIGITLSIYQSDGTFVGADNSEIDGAAGVTLIDSVDLTTGLLAKGETTWLVGTLSLAAANDTGELFLRIGNYAPVEGEPDATGPWGAVDDVQIVPEPVTLALLSLGGLLIRRKR